MARKLTWDEIREMLDRMDISAAGRTMIVTIIRDAYIASGTIIASIEGSPPRAYAILYSGGAGEFDPDNDDEVVIGGILLLSCCFGKRRLLRGPFIISLSELRRRRDIIVSVTPPVELLRQSG